MISSSRHCSIISRHFYSRVLFSTSREERIRNAIELELEPSFLEVEDLSGGIFIVIFE